jgi:cobalt/nickel transport system permease protein
LLLGWLVAIFALSALRDPALLAGLLVVAALVFVRGSRSVWRKVLIAVVPITFGLTLFSFLWLRLRDGHAPNFVPFLGLGLRATLIAFVSLSVLARLDLFRALAAWPTLTRLLVITLAQIHALRRIALESLLGLRSRLPRKPRTRDVVRGAGGITASLFTLGQRNARDLTDAMRSRGF